MIRLLYGARYGFHKKLVPVRSNSLSGAQKETMNKLYVSMRIMLPHSFMHATHQRSKQWNLHIGVLCY